MKSENIRQRKDTGVRSVSVDEEVQKLFKASAGKISQGDLASLRTKHGDANLVDKIQEVFIEKHRLITKKAKKFAELIRERYANKNYPFHILLDKAYKYKIKHGLTNDEFAEFQRIYETELVGLKSPELLTQSTNLQKVLGNVTVNYQGFGTLNEKDQSELQSILKLEAITKPLHSQLFLQSLQYTDCSPSALLGVFDRTTQNATNHIHPVIVALFLPKIDVLERHFLHSNIANLVKCRYNSEKFTSAADAYLYHSMIHDPNDVVCDSRSTMMDLHNRAKLQVALWNNVMSLRNGQYYSQPFQDFILSVDACKMNKYDTPDLVYGRYDGTILKRIVSAFSFNPTIVKTSSVYQIFSTNPYQQNIAPDLAYIPMINLKLPYTSSNDEPVDLTDAKEQTQLLIENGVPKPKHTSLIYSKGVLFFYVDRRAHVISIEPSLSLTMVKLPKAVSGFERLNMRPVNFETTFRIRQDEYKLRSVVVSEINTLANEPDIVVGSSTLIMIHPDFQTGKAEEYLQYDPYSVVKNALVSVNVLHKQPISIIPATGDGNIAGFMDMARTRGVIFMYELCHDATSGTVMW
jgi:hypothetical protein